MQECDICGRKTDKEYVVEIEGAEMHTCEKCARGKTPTDVIDHSIVSSNKQDMKTTRNVFTEKDQEMAEGYGDIIKNAREKAGLTNKDLAIKINEKESLIARIERNQLIPDTALVKKLEKALGIKLEAQNMKNDNKHTFGKNEPLTLWDTAIRKDIKERPVSE